MKLLIPWVKAIVRWFAEWKYFWVALGVTIVALLLAVRPGTTEAFVRLTGLVLQLLGVVTVVWGIGETRALFGHPSIVAIVRSRLARFPRFKMQPVTANGNSTSPGNKASGRADVMDSAGSDSSIEARVMVLEKNLFRTNQRIEHAQREFDSEVRNSNLALQREIQERTAEDQAIRAKLEATGTGGVHISVIGALWLFVGVTLSTASQEIFKWLN